LLTDSALASRIFHAVFAIQPVAYPSVRTPSPDSIKDRGQVRATWQWARDGDAGEQLRSRLAKPEELTDDEAEIVRLEEGWVLH
jgi:hypothetical protein